MRYYLKLSCCPIMKKIINNIVFTKNRPLQLDAYLESLYRYFPSELIQTYVIYKQQLFDKEYQHLFRKYASCVVIKENGFHSDFLRLLDQINTKFILFGVDDVVYFDSVDFDVINETFDTFSEDIFGFSLRFGMENIKGSGDPLSETVVAGQSVFSLNWTQGRTSTTRYPFELCCTIYRTALVKKVIDNAMNNNPLIRKLFSPNSLLVKSLGKVTSTRSLLKSFGYFYNPNTLESWNCRWCQNNAGKLPSFTYFQKLCAAAIQVNMVNTTTKNAFEGTIEHSVEALNDKYKQGYRLDIDFVARNKPVDTHGGPKQFKIRAQKSMKDNEMIN